MNNFRVEELQVSGFNGEVDPLSELGTPAATETMSTEWTDEKHSMYLKSMEASFVNQLYNSMDSRGRHTHKGNLSHIKSSKQPQFNSRAASGQFKVLRAGCWQKINFGRGEAEVSKSDGGDLLANPWILHFRSTCKPKDVESPIVQEQVICEEVDSSLKKEITSAPATCLKQFNVSHSHLTHQDMVGGNTEVSDQNFADEEIKEEKSITSCNSKRMKSLILQASSNDQVHTINYAYHHTNVASSHFVALFHFRLFHSGSLLILKIDNEELHICRRMHKSRKAIVLEQNPAMKNQLAQYDTTANCSWRNFKHKKEPPSKKQKVEPPQVPPKSAFKSGVSSVTTAKGRPSSSPLPSTPEKSASPFGMLNISKTRASADETIPSKVIIKDKPTPSLDKETSIRTSAAMETAGKGSGRARPTDLQSLLITLLMENPKGMSLKALEKGIGDSFPNCAKKIESILKKIANCQVPGKYLLKPGVELESFKKPLFESGSSPEESLRQTPAADDICDQRPAQEPEIKEKVSSIEMEEQGQGHLNATVGEELQAFQIIDNQQQSPDLFGEKRASDNSEARVASSTSESGSGSDSDSESDSSDSGSDSGSPSRSRSRSKSPIGSGSGSSSDSDSDVSSNSKEVSDEDVNIMSDDDKEPKHQTQASEAALPVQWGTPDGRPAQSGNDDKQDDLDSDAIDIETVEQDSELAVVSSSLPSEQPVIETKSSPPEHVEHHDRQNLVDSLFGKTTDKDDFRYEQSDSSERMSKGNLKRGLAKHSDEKSERRKRSKMENSSQPSASLGKGVQFSEDSHKLSPDRLIEGSYKGPVSQMLNKADRDGNTELGSQKGYTQAVSGRYTSESKQSSRKSYDHSAQAKAPEQGERPDRYSESLGLGLQYSEKSSHVHEGFPMHKDNVHSSSQKDSYANEKKVPRNAKEGGSRGKQSVPLDSHYQKHGDVAGKIKEDRQVSSVLFSSSPRGNRNGADRSPVVNGRASKLQREVSELELGELREAVAEETPVKKQFERKSSFKQSETKLGSRDNWASDFSKAKPTGKTSLELGKPSSPDLNLKFPSNAEGLVKKRKYEDRIEDLTGSQQRALQSQSQHLSRVDHSDVVRPFSRSADNGSKSTHNEVGGRQGISLDGYGESNKKASLSASQHHDSKRGSLTHTNNESKRPASSMVMEQTDVRKDSMLAEGTDSDRKRRDSSSDENSCSYTKYEKDEPELKGPIQDFSQYKEYVQEYHDKYDSYCSLNKILESYRNEFLKLGKDLDFATGTERYYNILDQLKESYRQCGSRHKRLKKIFVVLHEELKHLKQRIKDFALPYTKD